MLRRAELARSVTRGAGLPLERDRGKPKPPRHQLVSWLEVARCLHIQFTPYISLWGSPWAITDLDARTFEKNITFEAMELEYFKITIPLKRDFSDSELNSA